MARSLVLGGGFGGIAVATELKRRLGSSHEVVLVDRSRHFSMGLRKLWELVGLATIEDGRRARALLGDRGIDVVQDEVTEIDPARRAAVVGERAMEADFLVVALGAVPRPDLVPGLSEHAHDVWSAGSIPGARDALETFDGGRVVMLIAGAPYPCPPAPYECVMHVDANLRSRRLREGSEIDVATVQPMLMPNAGEAGSDWMAEQLAARGIRFRVGVKVDRVERGAVVLDGTELPFDLLLTVPPHQTPDVVVTSSLTGESGWIPVDRSTLETAHENVYAVGDVTGIGLANGLPLPKAGIIAELQGLRVAAAIAARERGRDEPEPFAGEASCFVEMGAELAARMDVKFYAEPAPEISLVPPSGEIALANRRFERERLERWFGG